MNSHYQVWFKLYIADPCCVNLIDFVFKMKYRYICMCTKASTGNWSILFLTIDSLSLSHPEIERKISIRSTREELIRKGVLKDVEADQTSRLATIEQQPKSAENSQNVQVEVTVSESNHVSSHGKYHQVNEWVVWSGDDYSSGWKVYSTEQ